MTNKNTKTPEPTTDEEKPIAALTKTLGDVPSNLVLHAPLKAKPARDLDTGVVTRLQTFNQ